MAAVSVVALGGTVTLFNDRDDPPQQGALPAAAVDHRLQSAPATELAGVSWRDFHGVQLPYSATDGPRTIDHDRVWGFTQTPLGALLAAVHLTVRSDPRWGQRVAEPTITQQFVGPDVAGLMASVNGYRPRAGSEAQRAYVVLEGFRWQGFTPDVASLDLVSAGPGDSDRTVRAATRVQLQWRNGDWRVVAPLAGTWTSAAAPVDSLDGYTRFPAGGRP
ncbi:hypothetical protein ACFQU9_03530 [Actinomadura namibiensis]|uniref:DUF8175 domain-containing protein n=1 Tax=Actinomadura namibiensis TaxID=182080 RepID=A0A7W3LYH2_ACTNM|nr:hypothetical protein [Actinomadura namibiensis]MBA8956535.1 hypothetical protein [Actinomadura namibiensis]